MAAELVEKQLKKDERYVAQEVRRAQEAQRIQQKSTSTSAISVVNLTSTPTTTSHSVIYSRPVTMSFSPSGRLIRSSNIVPKIPTTTVKSVPPIKHMLPEIEVLGVWTTEQAQAVANSMPKNPNPSRMVLRKRSLAEISPQTSPRAKRVTRLPVR